MRTLLYILENYQMMSILLKCSLSLQIHVVPLFSVLIISTAHIITYITQVTSEMAHYDYYNNCKLITKK